MALKFTQLVEQKLGPLFQKYDLLAYSVYENSLKLLSDKVTLLISYDEHENVGYLYAGKGEDTLELIDAGIIQKYFIPNLGQYFIIPQTTKEDFIENLYIFFTINGKQVLEGDSILLGKIRKEHENQNEQYKLKVLLEQELESADNAWKKGNYEVFINCIDKIKSYEFPLSFHLKYKIAKDKLDLKK